MPAEKRMDAEDMDVIARFAAGDRSLRAAAIEIHRRYIPTLGVRGEPHQDFMAEIDHPVPDLTMRARYRSLVLEIHGLPAPAPAL